MNKCFWLKNPEFQLLVKESEDNEYILAAKVSLWQEMYGKTMPTLEEVNDYILLKNDSEAIEKATSKIILDEVLSTKGGQYYEYLSKDDSVRFNTELKKGFYPKTFTITKKLERYSLDKNLKATKATDFKTIIYVKANTNPKSNLYNIVDENGELLQEKVRLLHFNNEVKENIIEDLNEEYIPTQVFNVNRSVAFTLYRLKPSKAKYVAQAKRYLYEALKFLPEESGLKINLDKIEQYLDSFPEEMWQYINTTFEQEYSNVQASIRKENLLEFKIPKLGLIQYVEELLGIKILNNVYNGITITNKLSYNTLINVINDYTKSLGYNNVLEEVTKRFNKEVANRIKDKFEEKRLLNGISHLDYFFSGEFNWLNINLNRTSGNYFNTYDTLSNKNKDFYQKPRAKTDFLLEDEIYNRFAAIIHEPFHALHALSYGTKEELELREAYSKLKATDFGQEMLSTIFKDYNEDTTYKEFVAYVGQMMLLPLNSTSLSTDIQNFISKIQALDSTIKSTKLETIDSIEEIQLNFLQKFYNYIVSALNKVIGQSKKFFTLIENTKLVKKEVLTDVFINNINRQEFLDSMDDFKSSLNTLMEIDGKVFSSENVDNFFKEKSYKQSSIDNIDIYEKQAGIKFTSGQLEALNKIDTFNKSDDKYFLLEGYAGTGKTSLFEYIQELNPNILFTATTNSASKNISKKETFLGKKLEANTIHKTLFGDDIEEQKLTDLTPKNTTIVIDEASLIDETLLDTIIKASEENNLKIIFVGDSAQLEPVQKDPKLFDLDIFNEHKVRLTEIKRSSNDIVHAATHIRNNTKDKVEIVITDEIKVTNLNEKNILDNFKTFNKPDKNGYESVKGNALKEAIDNDESHVVIVYSNKHRVEYNRAIRNYIITSKGLENELIIDNEILVGINNGVFTTNMDIISVKKDNVKILREHDFIVDNWVKGIKKGTKTLKGYVLSIQEDKTHKVLFFPDFNQASLHGKTLMEHNEDFLTNNGFTKAKKNKSGKYYNVWGGNSILTYGYSITGHKAQSREWDNVFIHLPYLSTDTNKHKYIYTAVSRAKKQVYLNVNLNYIKRVPLKIVNIKKDKVIFDITTNKGKFTLTYNNTGEIEINDNTGKSFTNNEIKGLYTKYIDEDTRNILENNADYSNINNVFSNAEQVKSTKVKGGSVIVKENFITEIDSIISNINTALDSDKYKASNKNDIRKQVAIAYGDLEYTYSLGRGKKAVHPADTMPEWLQDLARKTEQELNKPKGYFNQVLINRYGNGVGIGVHTDAESIYSDENGNVGSVAIISIGNTVGEHIIGGKGFKANSGSLVEMSTGKLSHSVSPAKGVRYSINFRHIPDNQYKKVVIEQNTNLKDTIILNDKVELLSNGLKGYKVNIPNRNIYIVEDEIFGGEWYVKDMDTNEALSGSESDIDVLLTLLNDKFKNTEKLITKNFTLSISNKLEDFTIKNTDDIEHEITGYKINIEEHPNVNIIATQYNINGVKIKGWRVIDLSTSLKVPLITINGDSRLKRDILKDLEFTLLEVIEKDINIPVLEFAGFDFNQPIEKDTKILAGLSNYTLNSGGAYGADTAWDQIGRQYGLINAKHFKDENNSNLSKTLKDKNVQATILTKKELDTARKEIKNLLGKVYKDDLKGNLQVRNYYQVSNSEGVFAIAKLKDNKAVLGGTNTAVQLGIKLNKEVHVFDIDTEQWYKYDYSSKGFIKEDTPRLTKTFAGIGTRDIQNYNVLNKETGKWESRKQYVGEAKKNIAFKAIKDVYEKTLKIKPEVKTEVTKKEQKEINIYSTDKNGYEELDSRVPELEARLNALKDKLKLKKESLKTIIPLEEVNKKLNDIKIRKLSETKIESTHLKGQQFFWYENGEKMDLFKTKLFTNESNILEEKGLKELHIYMNKLKKGKTNLIGEELVNELLKVDKLINTKYADIKDLAKKKLANPNIEVEERPADVIMPLIYKTQFSIKEGTLLEDVDLEYFEDVIRENISTAHIQADYVAINSNGKHKIIYLENNNNLIEAKTVIRNGTKYLVTDNELDYVIQNGIKVYYHPTLTDNEGNRLEVWIGNKEAIDNQYKSVGGFLTLEAKPNENTIMPIIIDNYRYYQKELDKLIDEESDSNLIDFYTKKILDFEELRDALQNGEDYKSIINRYIILETKSIQRRKDKYINNTAKKKLASWKKSLDFVVGRIPGQGMQSFMSMRVAKFIDTEQNTVIVPPEQLWFQGSDMDIDKANLIGYSFNNGLFVGWNKDFDITKKESFKLPLNLEGIPFHLQKKALKNYIVNNMFDIIQSGKNLVQRVRPMEMDELKDLIKDIKSIEVIFSPNQPISVPYQDYVNNTGSQVIGIAAVMLKVYSAISTMYAKNIEYFPNGGFTFKNKLYTSIANQDWSDVDLSAFADFLIKSNVTEHTDKNKLIEVLKRDMRVSHDTAIKLSSLLSAATDNAKELILAKINAIPGYADIYAVAYVLGIPTKDIASLMMSDEVKTIISRTQTSIFKDDKPVSALTVAKKMPKTQNIKDFLFFKRIADEYSMIGRMLNINIGLKVKPAELFLYGRALENYINNRVEIPKEKIVDGKKVKIPYKELNRARLDWIKKNGFSFEKFVTDKSYRDNWINLYENGITTDTYSFPKKEMFNILKVLDTNSHYMSYFNLYIKNQYIDSALSYKIKLQKRIVDELIDKEYIYSVNDNTLTAIYNLLDNAVITEFLKDKTFKVAKGYTINNKKLKADTTILLSTQEGRNHFIEWFNQFVIEMKTNINNDFFNNFIKNDRKNLLLNKRFSIWRLNFNSNNPKTIQLSIRRDSITNSLKLLLKNNTLDKAGNNIIDILYLYNLIINKDGNTKDSYSSVIPYSFDTNNLKKEFTEFQTNIIDINYILDNIIIEGIIQDRKTYTSFEDGQVYTAESTDQPIYNRKFIKDGVIIYNEHEPIEIEYNPLSIYDNYRKGFTTIKHSKESIYKSKRATFAILNSMKKKLELLGAKVILLSSQDILDKFGSKFTNSRAFLINDVIYVNTDLASANDLVHELGHLYMPYIKANKQLWNDLKELLKEHPLLPHIQNNYEDGVLEELFITIMGESKLFAKDSWWNRFKMYLDRIQTAINIAYKEFFNIKNDIIIDTNQSIGVIAEQFADDILKRKLSPDINIDYKLLKKYKVNRNCE